MSEKVGSIYYDLDLDDKKFNKKIGTASASWKSFGDDIGKGATTIASTVGKAMLATVAAAAAIAGTVLTVGTKFNSEIEQLQTSFEVMTGSSEKAAEVIDKLKKVGASTPYELAGLAQTTQTLMQYGLNADDALKATMNFGDIAQGSAEKMQSIALAYGQMSSAGKVNMQDIKQMINAGFNPLQAIADQTGKSMEKVTAEYEAGKVSVEDITSAMQYASSENGRYYQSMEKQSKTLNGQISTLKDNFKMLAGVLAGGVTASIKDNVLPTINNLLGTLTTAYQSGGIEGFATALGTGIADMAAKISSAAPKFAEVAILIIQNLIKGIQDNLPVIIQSAVTIVNSLITALIAILPQILTMGMQILTSLITGIITALPTIATTVVSMVFTLINTIITLLPQILQAGIDMFLALINGIVTALPTLIPTIIKTVLLLVSTLIKNLPLIIQAGLDIIVALINGLIEAIPDLIQFIPTILSEIVAALIQALPMIVVAAIQIIIALIKGIVVAIPQLIVMIPQIIAAIAGALVSGIGEVIKAGGQLVEGLWQGIKDAGTWIKDKITSWVGDVMSFIKKLFGIASPSKLMEHEVGFNLGAGIAKGIEKSVGMVKDAMGSMADAVEATVTPVINTSFVDWVEKGSGTLSDLSNGMYDSIGNLANKNSAGLTSGARTTASAIANGNGALAATPTVVNINNGGIIARSRSELRDISIDMLSAMNEDLKSRGLQPLGGSNIR